MQEGAKVEAKPEKVEKKKTKYVKLLSQGDVLLKGICTGIICIMCMQSNNLYK